MSAYNQGGKSIHRHAISDYEQHDWEMGVLFYIFVSLFSGGGSEVGLMRYDDKVDAVNRAK